VESLVRNGYVSSYPFPIIDNLYWELTLDQFIHYLGYCSVVVLYVYVFQNCESPQSEWERYLSVAEKCKEQLCFVVWGESFVHQCGVVLRDLHEEVKRRIAECGSRRVDDDMEARDGEEAAGVPGWVGVNGVVDWRAGTVIDRIDRWGFSSLTGY